MSRVSKRLLSEPQHEEAPRRLGAEARMVIAAHVAHEQQREAATQQQQSPPPAQEALGMCDA